MMNIESIPNPYLYPNGHPFTDPMPANLDAIKDLVSKKFPAMLIIDGGLSKGKTTCATELASYLEPEFDIVNQLAMGGTKFLKQCNWIVSNKNTHPGIKVIVYDEAGDLSKRGAMTQYNQRLLRFFETYRAFNIVPILTLPNFTILDQHLFDLQIPQMLIHCHKRGITSAKAKVYDYQQMCWLRNNAKSMVMKSNVYKTVYPVFYMRFKNLPPDKEKLLEAASTRGKKDYLKHTSMQLRNLVTMEDIIAGTGRSKVNIRCRMQQLGIKAVEKVGTKGYYDRSTITRVRLKAINQ